jgi:nitrogen fixation/metabolism regulation signal transduction histidine kinase
MEGPGMHRIREEYARAREIVDNSRSRDLRRGFTYTYVVLTSAIWLGAFALLVYSAHRISKPIHNLTAGLQKVAAGDLDARVSGGGDDEVGKAIDAFHDMAGELRHSRERLIYLTRIASWQTLARKMAHEVKNSLTPIRLTMEEIGARFRDPFLEQASQIVVDEVTGLERRVRAFSQFAAEPPVNAEAIDANALVEERIAFLGAAHPAIAYEAAIDRTVPPAMADPDLVKGILTNLLENAAQAMGDAGALRAATSLVDGKVAIEIHDSGPGLSEEARASLFEPTISFKKGGMGLGLSIARRSALLCGGDIVLIEGELGGAAFRVTLPRA